MAMTDHPLSPFGALLKTFRHGQRRTQQQLAHALGVHRRTLVRWEQGDYLPESKTLVLELARHLQLNEQDTRQLLEASLTALSPYWGVPLPRNPYFTGREEILSALHTQLDAHHPVALTQSSALQGLGGVGKTQIALEYAYRYGLEYSAVFWMEAETEEQMRSSLLRMAEVSRARQALALLGEQEEGHALAQRARSLSSQVPAETHPAAVASRESTAVSEPATAEQDGAAMTDAGTAERQGALRSLRRKVDGASSTSDPLQAFLSACCELHPRAWCRSAELWRAYQRWAEEQHERYPLSRGALVAQLKAHGCCANRTNTARTWRGIALVNRKGDGE